MDSVIRTARLEDADACGRICFEAFAALADRHGFARDFSDPDLAIDLARNLISHPGFYSVVAEREGRVIGSNFMDERSPIAGIGPISVDPGAQDAAAGRELMRAALERAEAKGFPGVRLVQAAYHNRSLSLYSKLGFEVREPLVVLQGAAIGQEVPGYVVRAATEADLAACNRVSFQVHGHERSGELADTTERGTAHVVEHGGRITGYTTGIAFLGHAVGETNSELEALIGAAAEFGGPGFLLPARNGELFRWCLARGLRVVQVMTLMSVGLYNEPRGAFLPSILY